MFEIVTEMSPVTFTDALPGIQAWIEEVLSVHSNEAVSLESFGFKRLLAFFSRRLLEHTKVVITNKCPVPPLNALGLSQFARFETGEFRGITFLDTYFVLRSEVADEALHFHELVHVIQWEVLGLQRFLQMYAEGVERFAEYKDNPLERIAYAHQDRFTAGGPPYDVEEAVRVELISGG
jgi:hypothetical protein